MKSTHGEMTAGSAGGAHFRRILHYLATMDRMRRHLVIAAFVALIAPATASPSLAAVGNWVAGENVRLRLLASGLDLNGQLDAAIEIELADGWHTYWINPGQAGIPPVFDFSGSQNVGKESITFPVPESWSDGQTDSNIYEGRVVLPVKVPVEDPAKPVRLAVKVDLGVCATVCIPVALSDAVEVKPGMTDLEALGILNLAAVDLPEQAHPGAFAVEDLTAKQTKENLYRLTAKVSVPRPDDVELFVAGPEGWFVGRAERVSGEPLAYSFPVEPFPAGKVTGVDFVAVLVSGGKAVTQTIRLDD